MKNYSNSLNWSTYFRNRIRKAWPRKETLQWRRVLLCLCLLGCKIWRSNKASCLIEMIQSSILQYVQYLLHVAAIIISVHIRSSNLATLLDQNENSFRLFSSIMCCAYFWFVLSVLSQALTNIWRWQPMPCSAQTSARPASHNLPQVWKGTVSTKRRRQVQYHSSNRIVWPTLNQPISRALNYCGGQGNSILSDGHGSLESHLRILHHLPQLLKIEWHENNVKSPKAITNLSNILLWPFFE